MSEKKNSSSKKLESLGIVKTKVYQSSFPQKIENANKLLEKTVLLKRNEVSQN